ncbi:MAG TPA: hypothetical protein VFU83_07215 [Pyrinomonadaceae bacterium]|nr:hypothetical protein [Pyrinomonadaceae bacterium]
MKPIALSFILLLSFVEVAGQDQRKQLDTLRAEGYEALYNLDYEGARKRFQKMIDLAPDHPAGAQCFASSLWLQQLNEAWELKSTLYSTDSYEKGKPQLNRAQVDEFRKWIRTSKQLSQARLKKDPRDVEALYFLGAAEGLEAAFAGGVERKFRAALRSGTDAVDHHKEVLKLSPELRDAELTIGLLNYVIGSLPLPVKMLAATMGVRGSKKRGLEALERVAAEGQWARDAARVLLIDLYKREKRWNDSFEIARQLSEKYPRNYLFKLQMADARVSEILTQRKKKAPINASQEQQVSSIFASLLRDKTLDRKAVELVNFRLNMTRQQLKQP